MPSGKQVLIHLLEKYALALQNDEDISEVSENLRVALLLHGSTPESMWYAVDRIEWASKHCDEDKEIIRQGLAVKGKNIFLSELLQYITWDESIPEKVKAEFPKLTEDEYNSATHIMYLLLSSMEWSAYYSSVEDNGKLDVEALEKFKDSYKKKLAYFRKNPMEFLGHTKEKDE